MQFPCTNIPDICKHGCMAIADTLISQGIYGKYAIIYVYTLVVDWHMGFFFFFVCIIPL